MRVNVGQFSAFVLAVLLIIGTLPLTGLALGVIILCLVVNFEVSFG